MLKKITTVLTIICFVGCVSVPLTSIPKLMNLKPESMDLTQTEVAIRIPEGFRIEENSVKLFVDTETPSPTEKIEEIFVLVNYNLVNYNLGNSPYLTRQKKKGFYIERFRTNPDDISRMNAYRREAIRLRREANGKATSGFFANVSGCLERGVNPFNGVAVTIYLRPDSESDFFPVSKEQRVPVVSLENGEPIDGAAEGYPICDK